MVQFQVIQRGGTGLLACAVNALSLALLQAGIPLQYTFFAFHFIAIDSNDSNMTDEVTEDSFYSDNIIKLFCNPTTPSEALFHVTLILDNITEPQDKILAFDYHAYNKVTSKGHVTVKGEKYFEHCIAAAKKLSPTLLTQFKNLLS